MKKTLLILTSISVFAGAGYALWAFTPVGIRAISTWLVRHWETTAKSRGISVDGKKLKAELRELSYPDNLLLFRATWYQSTNEGKQKAEYRLALQKLKSKLTTDTTLSQVSFTELQKLLPYE